MLAGSQGPVHLSLPLDPAERLQVHPGKAWRNPLCPPVRGPARHRAPLAPPDSPGCGGRPGPGSGPGGCRGGEVRRLRGSDWPLPSALRFPWPPPCEPRAYSPKTIGCPWGSSVMPAIATPSNPSSPMRWRCSWSGLRTQPAGYPVLGPEDAAQSGPGAGGYRPRVIGRTWPAQVPMVGDCGRASANPDVL